MDIATLLGILSAFGLVGLAVFMGGGLLLFINFPAFLIVVGGTMGATLIHYPARDLLPVFQRVVRVFFSPPPSGESAIEEMMALATQARREGVLSLEMRIPDMENAFVAKGLQLSVDGLDPSVVREILTTDLDACAERHEAGAEIFATMGSYAPALGMVGTLIGLIQMLQNLTDPDAIGPGMAVALLTTFYGALLANLVFLPLAGKLRALAREEAREKQMLMEGLISLARGEHPRVLEWRMRAHRSAFSPREKRV
ncbi:MotA/TolQ/ExbB proton channel family protein [Desulfobotulus sp. H1]|uniref:MotA/TolQ/ExbB proton channel family protein n=1 Tax=Desulfobotulus pelophilus TaxID=2823377 RepID=A0ABT3N8P2_9BACT|nr:MotA/TolQ/ExbB proton channel family protein [Desulfobotulus pelophilus]MCW7753810.1 MotA/TolQ/ExbB proton channel family protein [Desulfobotulus pelophilus]